MANDWPRKIFHGHLTAMGNFPWSVRCHWKKDYENSLVSPKKGHCWVFSWQSAEQPTKYYFRLAAHHVSIWFWCQIDTGLAVFMTFASPKNIELGRYFGWCRPNKAPFWDFTRLCSCAIAVIFCNVFFALLWLTYMTFQALQDLYFSDLFISQGKFPLWYGLKEFELFPKKTKKKPKKQQNIASCWYSVKSKLRAKYLNLRCV